MRLGELDGELLIQIRGSVEEPLKCRFTCLSQGPVVQISPTSIDWGLTAVLKDSPRVVLLSNESLIDAKFTTYTVRTFNSCFCCLICLLGILILKDETKLGVALGAL
jgi:hypothetical protein